ELQHHCERAIQYEFYIPAAVWSHSAVKEFREFLETKLSNGATIFKTAVGVWKGDEEDTNIYRLIVRPKETQAGQDPDPADHRQMILDAIEKMMAHLAEWKESRQKEFLFTVQIITASKSLFTDRAWAALDLACQSAKSPRRAGGTRRR
ncbi:MAG TPA: hypothetical protein VND64_21865, partial [Pirellulales bacterium]|nr:hypothetical protein [Pirellulales bacterium]